MKKFFLIISSLLLILTACSTDGFVSSNYEHIETMENDLGDSAQVYTVENKTVKEVAQEIIANEKPKYVSKESDTEMFILYPQSSNEEFIQITQDPINSNHTVVEVANEDFAENSYDFSLLEAMGVLGVAATLYGWNKADFDNKKKRSGYRGYVSAFSNNPANFQEEEGSSSSGSGGRGFSVNIEKKSSESGSIRSGSTVRGGGPGTGK
ncbi:MULTISPECIES: DUF4247 domain-containing protein [Bacillus]|uniref:DUF4247 domain-containing protein n=1 Tax=Bacillus TaxID=1386 RepID=UPI000312B8F8|nr:DUF4247 domain-containing protein [Bacillus pseudomycoides]MED1595904.1 DUF4247 domain-containing protein [Bacillus pseudomycoides]MED4710788.1 DUF4247 domain-containing protein [Bacillus pseudomycoides]OOR52610.1 hypothetical protein BLX05_09160 [Bacillus pseudomycoides]PDY14016.1 DUF4247 domain-containing protein [Bacillus pseudomycoides]PEU45182.1 DUF4247 domain-containing protein [Bacillus pseudomycoides]